MNSKVESYTRWMENLANDNSHGYQWGGWGPQDYDCSHAVITAVEQAGIPVKEHGATYTGNMLPAFLACGFVNVIGSINLATGAGLQRGDIPLNTEEHVVVYIGNGKISHARSAEGNTMPGDQSGNEIRIQSYWNYPWNAVLRFASNDNTDTFDEPSYSGEPNNDQQPYISPINGSNNKNYPDILKYGDVGDEVKDLQNKLNALDFNCGEADGIFGKNTLSATKLFQRRNGLYVDGEAGPDTLNRLNELYSKLTNTHNGVDTELQDDAISSKNTTISIGDVVNFIGDTHYVGANFTTGVKCKPGMARVTAIREGTAHPYHLIKLIGSESTVYGWVDTNTITKEE